MTEADWLACSDPYAMLDYLTASRGTRGWSLLAWLWPLRARGTERWLRLFAAACCRRLWELLPDPRSRAAVEAAERFADRLVGRSALKAAAAAAAAAAEQANSPWLTAASWEARAQARAADAAARVADGAP